MLFEFLRQRASRVPTLELIEVKRQRALGRGLSFSEFVAVYWRTIGVRVRHIRVQDVQIVVGHVKTGMA